MNFVKIIKSLQDLDRKHQVIKKKFSSDTKANYVYKNCLREDEVEDLRIYGHTHADTISKFKRRFRASAHQTRSDKSLNVSTMEQNHATNRVGKPYIRAKTAHRIPSRKANKVLQIYDKSDNNKFLSSTNCSNGRPHTAQLLNKKQHVVRSNMEIRKKSIAKFKKQFNSHFMQDIQTAKAVASYKRSKQKTKTVCFGSQETIENSQDINFFQLTQNRQLKKKTTSIVQSNPEKQQSMLKMLNSKIFQSFHKNYVSNTHLRKKNWDQYTQKLQVLKETDKLSFVFVSTSCLSIFQVQHTMLDLLPGWIQEKLKFEKILHLHILKHSNEQYQILFEEFLISPSLSIQYLQWPKLIFRYYLRRFLLLSNENVKVQAVIEEQQTFFQNFHKVPRKFYRFIHELDEKPYSIITHKLNRNQGHLSELLEKGFNQIQMRRLNWNPKKSLLSGIGIKKHCRTKNNSQKQIYFCICFFLLVLKQYKFEITLHYQQSISYLQYQYYSLPMQVLYFFSTIFMCEHYHCYFLRFFHLFRHVFVQHFYQNIVFLSCLFFFINLSLLNLIGVLLNHHKCQQRFDIISFVIQNYESG